MRSPRTHSTRKLPGFIGLIALLCSALLGLSGHAASYKIDRPAIQIDRLDQDEISKRSSGSGSADFVVPEFLHLAKIDSVVGYIRGSNDSLPEILSKVGIDVEVIEISDIPQTDLRHYSAILVGPYAHSLSGDDDIDLKETSEKRLGSELESWDSVYRPLIRTRDGKTQAILVDYGKGTFLYFIYPLASEIGAGNSESPRLLDNLISTQNSDRNSGSSSSDCNEVEFAFDRSNGTYSSFACDGAPRNC